MSSVPMTLYISGPMSGIPEHNFPLFNDVTRKLRNAGHIVYNPAEHFSGRTDLPRERYMAEDFRKLLEVASADTAVKGVVMLPGWENSRGAIAEVACAQELALQFFEWQGDQLSQITIDRRQSVVTESIRQPLPDTLPDTGETRITDPKTGGQKGQKDVAFDLLPWGALAEVAKLYRYGADKYKQAHNWRLGYKWSLSFAAMMRHATAFWEGEELDPESKHPHLTSVVFHALAMITYGKENLGTDDRPHRTLEALRALSQPQPVREKPAAK